MRTIVTLALKDVRLLVRDRWGLFWILVFPLLFALFFGAVFSGFGSRGTNALSVAVVDQDDSEGSRALIKRLNKPDALKVQALTLPEAQEAVRKGSLVAY